MEIKYREYLINEVEKGFKLWLSEEKGETLNSLKARKVLLKIRRLELNELISLCKNENIRIPLKNINIWNNIW